MHLKTFAAPSLTQAMADVRREMGPDAVIIATGDAPDGGVQVRAASDMARVTEPAEQVRDRSVRLAGEADIERGLREDNELDRVIRALGFHRAPGSAAQALIRSAHDLSDGQAVARLAHAIESRYTFQPLPAVPEHAVLFAGTPGSARHRRWPRPQPAP